MTKHKKVEFTTVGLVKKDRTNPSERKTIRINIVLPESNEKSCPEFSYGELLSQYLEQSYENSPNAENVLSTPMLDPSDPFAVDEDAALKALARKLERKYTPQVKRKKKWQNSFKTLGEGYDETDPFIDNSDALDEALSPTKETKHGGFYINSGELDFEDISLSEESSSEDEPTHRKKKKVNHVVSDEDEEELSDSEQVSGEEHQARVKKKRLHKNGMTVQKKLKLDDGELLRRRKKEIERFNAEKQDKVHKIKKDEVDTDANICHSKPLTLTEQSVAASIEAVISKACKEAEEAEDKPPSLEKVAEEEDGHADDDDDEEEEEDEDDEEEEEAEDDQGKEEEKSSSGSSSSSSGEDSSEASSSSESESESDKGAASVEKVLEEVEQAPLQDGPKVENSLPDDLSPCLIALLDKLKEAGTNNSDGSSQRFFTEPVKKLLLSIELELSSFGVRKKNQVYSHVSKYLPCGTQTVIKRAKALIVEHEEAKLVNPVKRGESAPSIPSDSKDGKKTKMPRKKFVFTDETRNLLYEIIQLRVRGWHILRKRAETPENYIMNYLENELEGLWPKGWMTAKQLYRESQSVHAVITNKPSTKADSGESKDKENDFQYDALPTNTPKPCLTATITPKLISHSQESNAADKTSPSKTEFIFCKGAETISVKDVDASPKKKSEVVLTTKKNEQLSSKKHNSNSSKKDTSSPKKQDLSVPVSSNSLQESAEFLPSNLMFQPVDVSDTSSKYMKGVYDENSTKPKVELYKNEPVARNSTVQVLKSDGNEQVKSEAKSSVVGIELKVHSSNKPSIPFIEDSSGRGAGDSKQGRVMPGLIEVSTIVADSSKVETVTATDKKLDDEMDSLMNELLMISKKVQENKSALKSPEKVSSAIEKPSANLFKESESSTELKIAKDSLSSLPESCRSSDNITSSKVKTSGPSLHSSNVPPKEKQHLKSSVQQSSSSSSNTSCKDIERVLPPQVIEVKALHPSEILASSSERSSVLARNNSVVVRHKGPHGEALTNSASDVIHIPLKSKDHSMEELLRERPKTSVHMKEDSRKHSGDGRLSSSNNDGNFRCVPPLHQEKVADERAVNYTPSTSNNNFSSGVHVDVKSNTTSSKNMGFPDSLPHSYIPNLSKGSSHANTIDLSVHTTSSKVSPKDYSYSDCSELYSTFQPSPVPPSAHNYSKTPMYTNSSNYGSAPPAHSSQQPSKNHTLPLSSQHTKLVSQYKDHHYSEMMHSKNNKLPPKDGSSVTNSKPVPKSRILSENEVNMKVASHSQDALSNMKLMQSISAASAGKKTVPSISPTGTMPDVNTKSGINMSTNNLNSTCINTNNRTVISGGVTSYSHTSAGKKTVPSISPTGTMPDVNTKSGINMSTNNLNSTCINTNARTVISGGVTSYSHTMSVPQPSPSIAQASSYLPYPQQSSSSNMTLSHSGHSKSSTNPPKYQSSMTSHHPSYTMASLPKSSFPVSSMSSDKGKLISPPKVKQASYESRVQEQPVNVYKHQDKLWQQYNASTYGAGASTPDMYKLVGSQSSSYSSSSSPKTSAHGVPQNLTMTSAHNFAFSGMPNKTMKNPSVSTSQHHHHSHPGSHQH